MTVLSIDSSQTNKIVVTLQVKDRIEQFISESKSAKGSQVILLAVHELLDRCNIAISQIDKIRVNEGPGSYTGLRVGAAIANALGFILRKPINNKRIGEFIKPKYE